MRINLLTVGKTDIAWVRTGLDTYVSRICRYMPFSLVETPELRNTASLGREQIKAREGELLLKHVRPSDFVVLLDERGKEFTSKDFSSFIEKKMQTVAKRLVFVVGGPYGFSEDVYQRANEKISLSKMTFPHDLIRLIFTEQLYRACTIIRGEPYHHE